MFHLLFFWSDWNTYKRQLQYFSYYKSELWNTCGSSIFILCPVLFIALSLSFLDSSFFICITSFICVTTCIAEECNNIGKAEWAVCYKSGVYQFYLAFNTVKLESPFLTASHPESGVKYKLKDEKNIFRKLKNGNFMRILFCAVWVRTGYVQCDWKWVLHELMRT